MTQEVQEQISVIIPLYNKDLYIAKAINSVLNQTFTNFELIIVNDGSTDKSEEVVKNFKDPRIKYFKKENAGVSSSRNFGIRQAKFSLIAFLDGDDWWSEDFLSVLLDLRYKFSNGAIWCGQYVQVNKTNENIRLSRFPEIEEGFFNLYDYLYAVWSSSILVRKDAFYKCGFFNEKLTHGEDTDMWIRISLKFPICYTNKVIAYYNIAGNPLTRSVGKRPAFERHFLSVIDSYIGKGYYDWDKILIEKKAGYLQNFYVQFPKNKYIREMIKSLPTNILCDPKYNLFGKTFTNILFLNFKYKITQVLLYYRNLIILKIKK